jgi:hypothetical protein
MKFKAEPPTESGYYWIVNTSDMDTEIVFVYFTGGKYYSLHGYSDEIDSKHARAFIRWGERLVEPLCWENEIED